jgi:hypothetical protein
MKPINKDNLERFAKEEFQKSDLYKEWNNRYICPSGSDNIICNMLRLDVRFHDLHNLPANHEIFEICKYASKIKSFYEDFFKSAEPGTLLYLKLLNRK